MSNSGYSIAPNGFSTLVDALSRQAGERPEGRAFTFLRDGEAAEATLTFRDLDLRARALAGWLAAESGPGERALLLFPPGLEFVEAYFGCLYAGLITVPCPLPRTQRDMPRVEAIAADCGAVLALTTTAALPQCNRLQGAGSAPFRWLATDRAVPGGVTEPFAATPEALALLQYTSGSTARPKGVMVRHRNLLDNLAAIARSARSDVETVAVSWLPHFHDMGLIGIILHAVFAGFHCVLMSPTAFLKRPSRWLRAISCYAASHSGGPDFGFDHCVRQVPASDIETLDLSSWQVAFSGAEPVRPATLEGFTARFSPCGFRRSAFVACYGLAEATLLVGAGERGCGAPTFRFSRETLEAGRPALAAGDDPGRELVSCGRPVPGVEVAFVDPHTGALRAEGEIGEIWTAGPGVAAGYWNLPAESDASFRAHLAGGAAGEWLRTGDLGFQSGGELFVTGRLKDLIIVSGRNLAPQDLELSAERSHPELISHGGAAFAVESEGRERIVLVQEVARSASTPPRELIQAVRQQVAHDHEVPLDAVVLVRQGRVPRTTSGKIQRSVCRDQYLAGRLEVIAVWEGGEGSAEGEPAESPTRGQVDPHDQSGARSRDQIAAWLSAKLAERIGLHQDELDPGKPYAYYGLRSADMAGIAAELESWLDRRLPAELLWDFPSLAELADGIATYLAEDIQVATTSGVESPVATASEITGDTRNVAIVGMGCRFPGADSPEAFWDLLCKGLDVVGDVPSTPRGLETGGGGKDGALGAPARGAFLPRIDLFDRHLFGLSAAEAEEMDPQQRLLLEVVWETVEHAGIRPESLAGLRTGVFIAAAPPAYGRLIAGPGGERGLERLAGRLGCMAANRVSYTFDWTGPSLTVDAACSSSLVALDLARQQLGAGEIDAAIVGGVNLIIDAGGSALLAASELLSPEGRCRVFDDAASGFVRGEGVAAVLLKPLVAARRDGDQIWAVIRGSVINHDGHFKLGPMTPSVRAQRRLAEALCAATGVDPATVGLIEAHAAGTPLGDSLEVLALSQAFGAHTSRRGFCALGAVKSNLGHGEAVSGLAGLLKATLALHHGALPPTLHLERPNRNISFEETPFFINDRLRPWPAGEHPRRAVVGASGIGGTNVEVLLEEPPPATGTDRRADRSCHLLVLSAPTPARLKGLVAAYRRFLARSEAVDLADLCFTAATGRRGMPCRLAVVARDREQLADRLSMVAVMPGWEGVESLEDSQVYYGHLGAKDAEGLRDATAAAAMLSGETRRVLACCCSGRRMGRYVLPCLGPLGEGDVPQPLRLSASDWSALLRTLARLWVRGVEVDWERLDAGEPRRRVRLPGVRFEREPYWAAASPAHAALEDGGVPPQSALAAPPSTAAGGGDPSDAPCGEPSSEEGLPASSLERLEEWLRQLVAAAVSRPPAELDGEANFHALGLDSIAAIKLIHEVEAQLEVTLSPLEIFEHCRINALAALLESRAEQVPVLPCQLSAAEPGEAILAPPEESLEPFPCVELQVAFLMARDLPAELGGRGCRIYCETRIPEALDLPRLQEAFQRVVRRHPILRTVFPGGGRQQVLSTVPVYEIRCDDLRGLPPAEAEARCLEVRRALATSNPPPDRWPLLQVQLCRTGEEEHRLFLSTDMLQGDFLSLLIMVRDWRELYRAPQVELPPLGWTFRQYVAYLEELRESPRYAADRAYWLERLEEFPPSPRLPIQRGAATAARPDFASCGHLFAPEVWERLKGLARAHQVTPSAVVATLYSQVLAEWSGEGRFVLNLPVFNRHGAAAGVEAMMGPFATNVLLAVELAEGLPFWEQVHRLHLRTLETLEHRLFSGVELSRALIEHRRSGLAPVAPVVLTSALYDGELWGELEVALSQTAMVWLDCIFFQDRGSLRLFWDYVEDLFDSPDLERRFRRLVDLLERLARDGDLPLWSPAAASGEQTPWPELPETDRRLILAVNDTAAPHPDTTLAALISEQAARTPDAAAILAVERMVTYRQLEEESNRVANALIARGVMPDSRVALALRRGADAIVAAVGILKTGAGYVPVDPDYPAARRRVMLEVCEPAAVLTSLGVLAAGSSLRELPTLEIAGGEVANASPFPPARRVAPENLAYVLFTSGSTGRPKGAMLTHRNAVNTLYHSVRLFRVTPEDRLLGFSSMSFDMSVWDIFGALVAGAAVVTLEPGQSREPRHWLELLRRHRVTIWNSVPTGMKLLLDFWEGRGAEGACPLRLALLGGDWIPLNLPDRIRRFFPGAEVVSVGGPTECCLWQNCFPVGEVDPAWKSIPYGKPMPNHQMYLLDDRLAAVPVGEVGEIVYAGAGVGLGYLNDPERTARSFVFHPGLGRRIYRSGDLGRCLPDGNVEIVGRRDHQVKIRGYRVELGEIDAALQAHDAVDASATVAWRDETRGNQLAAFYATRRPVAAADLRAHLASRLPAYMVPAKLEELPALPLNANGKIDRGELMRRLGEGVGARQEAQPGDGETVAAGETGRFQAVSLSELDRLLAPLRQMEVRGKPKYLWPSGGGLYPVQTYVVIQSGRVAGLEGGVYYHHPARHALCLLDAETGPPGDEAFKAFLVGEMDAVEPMYGDKARDLCFFEAGLMADLLAETASGLELALTPAAGTPEPEARRLLGLRDSQILLQELRGGPGRGGAGAAQAAWPLAAPLRSPASPAAPVALPAASDGRPFSAQAIEERLLGLWRELFKMEHLHADDHFFEIGGNSQLAVLAIRRAGEELGLEIQVANLFSYPTVRALSGHLAAKAGASAPPVRPAQPASLPGARNPYAGLPFPKGVQLVAAEERESFKNRQEGIRHDLDGADAVELQAGLLEEVRALCTKRRSWRRYAPGPLDAAQLQGLLAGCLAMAAAGRLHVYLHVKPGRVSELAGGIYFLDPGSRRLVAVSAESERVTSHLHFPHNRRLFDDAAFSLFLVAEVGAVAAPSPERARELCLLATGASCRRLETDAAAAGVGLCHIGMMNSEPLRDVLALGDGRIFLHSLLGGVLGLQELAEAEDEARTLRDPRQTRRTGDPAAAIAPSLAAPPLAAPPLAAAPAASPPTAAGEGPRRPPAIAIIGMAGRFPEAADLDAYWRLLREGVEVVREVPPERWEVASYFDSDVDRPGFTYSRWGSFLADLEGFDPLFFHVSPTEARVMDPQQRLLLALAWETLEMAGYAGGQLAGSRTGVFIGASQVHHRESYAGRPQDAYMGLGIQPALLANRISYFLDLRGPSLTLDTLCSSSLVAIHLACRSLRDGECDLALAGGVHLGMTPTYFEGLSRLGALSPTGHCYTFDRRADGIACGEGAGVVLLKRLDDALAARDHVVGVLRGSAVNHGGRAAGLTVPNALAQAELVRSALADAGVSPHSLGYLEAHGTGTSLGDPIEIDGLDRAFRADTRRSQFCAIGSVKTNLGHLDAAAGIAGLLKVLLALRARELPPTLHLQAPNPAIAFEVSPFYVNDRLRPWPRNGGLRRAGVSAFGMGGANAHVIVEEAPPPAGGGQREREGHLLTLSARSSAALERQARRFEGALASSSEEAIGDICYSANSGRAPLPHRLAVTGRDLAELRQGLGRFVSGEAGASMQAGQARRRGEVRVAMLFTGQGAQRPGMGRELFATQPAFQRALERCAALFDPLLEVPLLSVMFPAPGSESLIHETAYTQPALFALEVALAELWRSWGIAPAAVLGHSIGELAAACVAGVFSLEDGVWLVAERGRRMQTLPRTGDMAVVSAGEEPIAEALAPYRSQLSIAALNGPENTVVSGEAAALEALLADLDRRGVRAQRLQVSHAFHSPLMEPILEGFEAAAARIAFQAPTIPLVSNLSGRLLAPGEVPDAAYWRRHVRQAVRFAAGVESLVAAGYDLLLEVGPAPVLTGMARRLVPSAVSRLASLRPGKGEWAALLESLGALFVHGAAVDWEGVERSFERRRVPLPTYPFDNAPWRLEPSPAAALPAPHPVDAPPRRHRLLGEQVEIDSTTGKTICFDHALSLAEEPLVADHRLLGTGVLAGVVQLDLLLAAFQAVHGKGPARARDFSFREALTAGSAAQVMLRAELRVEGDGYEGRVLSRPLQERNGEPPVWTEHCHGRLEPLAAPPPRGPAPAGLAATLGEEDAGEAFYSLAAGLGVVHGPAFRTLLGLRRREGQALARLRRTTEPGRYVIDPGVLDGAFQAGLALIMAGGDRPGLYLPVAIGEVKVYGATAAAAWAWVRASGEGGPAADEPCAEIALLDDDGHVAMELSGLRARKVRGAGMPASASGQGDAAGWLQQVRWRDLPMATARPVPAGTWLVWPDAQGVGEALCRRLEGEGRRCLRVVSASGGFAMRPDGAFTVDPARPEEMARLLAAVDEAAPDLAGIIHLVRGDAGEDEPETPAELQRRLADGVWSLFRLVQAAASRRRPGLELWVVTAGAGAGSPAGRVDPDKAALWGLLRTVAKEHGSWSCHALDLPWDPAPAPARASWIYSALTLATAPLELAWRSGGLQEPRIEPAGEPAADGAAPIRADGVYLVTGGQGALGLECARALVEEAVRRGGSPALVLLNRSPLPAEDGWEAWLAGHPADDAVSARLRAIRGLRDAGARVWPVAGDVADLETMRRLVTAIRERYGGLHGVLHAAGVVRDEMLRTKSEDSFHAVLAPKVFGAWVLDRVTRDGELDFFALFSSLVARVGNSGQGDYAAANAYLDAVALERRRCGLPAVSLGWGPWGEVGMAARAKIDVRAFGLEPIPTALGRRLFLAALACPADHWLLFGTTEKAAPARAAETAAVSGTDPGDRRALESQVRALLAGEVGKSLGLPAAEVDPQANFMELGLDSLMAVRIKRGIEEAAGLSLDATLLFEYPSVGELAAHLVSRHEEAFRKLLEMRCSPLPAPVLPAPPVAADQPAPKPSAVVLPAGERDVAIIGLACRLPGATTPDELWQLLRAGVDVITEVPEERWSWRDFYDPDGRPGTTRSRWGGFLAGVKEFDPLFFGISPREAAYLDPQQRLFLEVVWETLERAGYTPEQLAAQRTGVFVGIATNEYAQTLMSAGQHPEAHVGSGNVLCMVPNRVSYIFNWNGPSMAVDTACSASLAAVHLACRSLGDGEADLAVVGGTNLILSPNPHIVFSRAGMLSPDGRCHTFDDSANGYVRGEGVMAVLLKPLARAAADGDEVWAVIKGTAMNHDGHSKVGLTAPNPKAQREVIAAALERAGVAPSAVGYIEAHGTGTAMGDPIEIRGLTDVFQANTDRCGFCAVGSIKTNLGHLEPAAGIAGLLKAVLALKHRQLPPTLHLQRPNRSILFEETPFFLNDRLRLWESPAGPRIAGVSSFGFGGVNVHAVLAEAPPRENEPRAADRGVHVLALSARSAAALDRLVASYLGYLDGERPDDPRDICFTANTGRRHFAHRLAVVFAGDRRDLREALAKARFRAEPPPGPDRFRSALAGLAPAAAAVLRRSCSSELWEERLLSALPPAAETTEASLPAGSLLWPALLTILAELYTAGVDVDWAEIDRGFARRRVPLPTYPFERQVYWPARTAESGRPAAAVEPAHPESPAPWTGGDGNGHRPLGTAAPSAVALPAAASIPDRPEIDQVRHRLETYLGERLGPSLGVAPAALDAGANLAELGLESVATMELLAAVKKDFSLTVYPGEVLERPTIRELAAYLAEELRAQERLSSGAASDEAPGGGPAGMVFLLSSPRSGSTLLRVMLAGHPQLFCPPELHLLPFRTMGERQARLAATYLGEGLERAFMELAGVDPAGAKRRVQELVDRDAGVEEVYALLRRLAGGRLLMDKSPSYAAQKETLSRAEELFESPRYLCLVRHPYAVVESFLRLRIHKLLGTGDVDPRAIAEETWTRSNRNLLDLLAGPTASRCHLVVYEELVRDPEAVLRGVCGFLGVPFHPAVLEPYAGERMTDGIHEASLAIGDPNFREHSGIDASLAEVWRKIELSRPLGSAARVLARELGYQLREDGEAPSRREGRAERSLLVPIQPGGEARPLYCFHPSGGQVFAYQPLAAVLGAGQPVYALQSPALENPARERGTLEEMARDYVAALRAHSPQGPYRLLGWSMGGHLAMVAAKLLEAAGEEVELVGILDSRYPVSPPDTAADPLQGLACAFGGAIGAAISQLTPTERASLRSDLASRSPEDRLRRAVGWACEAGALPPGLPVDELVRQAALVEAHLQLLERYRPQPIQAPLRVWWAREELARRPRTDWGRFTSGEVRYSVVPGTHFTMIQQPGLRQIGEELRDHLRELDGRRRLIVPAPSLGSAMRGGVA